jgi:D-alanyl-D-alanine carboxypeptidase/D-alanyl-D-alanine-endopeptidase (penicillin-binding protein 4)
VRRRLSLLALVALLALTALVPAARAVDRAGLRSTLTTLHHRLGPAAGAYVVDLASGEVLYSHRENLALAPASNEKLFTTAATLLRFGASATLPTMLQAAPGTEIDADGVLRGDVYLVGGGDPTLGDTGLQALADQLVARGVVRIDGGVIGDESLFDTLRGGPDSAYRPDGDLGGWLTALSWRHGRAGAAGPAKGAATKLAALLKARKIRYERKPRAGKLSAVSGDGGVAATDAEPLATLTSPPIATLIAETNIPSENFYAEMLIKALGARFGAGGTTTAGLAVTRAQLAAFGIHPKLADGSGLSRINHTTTREVVRLLERMDGQDNAATWTASLPVAGRSGTLRHRMRATAAAGRCAAKTGTLIGVSALSGYCTSTGGVRIAFSFIENKVCNYCAKKVEDRMVSAMARLDG